MKSDLDIDIPEDRLKYLEKLYKEWLREQVKKLEKEKRKGKKRKHRY